MNRIPRFTRLVAALGLGLSLATTLLARPRACKSRSTGPNCPAARRSTMRCCPGRSISPVPASVRC